jgi:hypothetical protein
MSQTSVGRALANLPGLTPTGVGAVGGVVLGANDVGEPVVLFIGVATSNADIVTEVGADDKYADGSLYISAVDGAGTLWQKRNDTWTSI